MKTTLALFSGARLGDKTDRTLKVMEEFVIDILRDGYAVEIVNRPGYSEVTAITKEDDRG